MTHDRRLATVRVGKRGDGQLIERLHCKRAAGVDEPVVAVEACGGEGIDDDP
ncbi:MAG: hypothetical protein WKF82_02830 [Nocardioidaceae bacterium]